MGGGFICKTSYRAGTILLFELVKSSIQIMYALFERFELIANFHSDVSKELFRPQSFSFSKVKLISKIYLPVWSGIGRGCLMFHVGMVSRGSSIDNCVRHCG